MVTTFAGVGAGTANGHLSLMANARSHWLSVRDKPGLLHRLMTELAGDARVSFEGDLSRCVFPEHLIVSREEIGAVKRSTLAPELDFVVVRLTADAVAPIFKQVMAAGLTRGIIHVQIEVAGVLELGAYDHFHADCVVTGPRVTMELLEELRSTGVLRGFEIAEPDIG
jgi:predicted ThiF/HesA family dinucleotide-utilizing enzyme